ncbi:hypothetical protein ATY89_08855 [Sulfolobus acidocaldarius]|uniref:Uncharacterized protein n=3 Tax=Sulfolobus acidocaldarius TaxID=2285 RepID=A0A0U3H556_9CREN|nr:hypothetical protein SacN8_09045 [Sulfolobus acidocaldarius N8]AGE74042.1 hypothetical protein SacRon12I_09065 [Sulfolobus acidocaldarius Ron12/I]ALU30031.1 hypothetical protein ATY89_08855 [Sulfolobus acidocaldarius]ALU30721.1 hypothetical protein ATZ20_00265 [Sulfolobus acidocaldarius]WCM35656.1 hypothetical protein GO597_10095 [Sulfolobus acidocaldarius DSM 639]
MSSEEGERLFSLRDKGIWLKAQQVVCYLMTGPGWVLKLIRYEKVRVKLVNLRLVNHGVETSPLRWEKSKKRLYLM